MLAGPVIVEHIPVTDFVEIEVGAIVLVVVVVRGCTYAEQAPLITLHANDFKDTGSPAIWHDVAAAVVDVVVLVVLGARLNSRRSNFSSIPEVAGVNEFAAKNLSEEPTGTTGGIYLMFPP